MENFRLRFNFSGSNFHLEVFDAVNDVEASYNLRASGSSIVLSAGNGNYYIDDSGAPINEDNDLPHKLQIGGGNTQTFTESILEGIGIMDLRDMGRQGEFTVTYDLACGSIRIDGNYNEYPLWIKPSDPECFTVYPPEE